MVSNPETLAMMRPVRLWRNVILFNPAGTLILRHIESDFVRRSQKDCTQRRRGLNCACLTNLKVGFGGQIITGIIANKTDGLYSLSRQAENAKAALAEETKRLEELSQMEASKADHTDSQCSGTMTNKGSAGPAKEHEARSGLHI
jgi:hypothetical protein